MKIFFFNYYRNKLFHKFHNEFIRERKIKEENIPNINLEQKHIKNLKVLIDRQEMLKEMPKNSVCAEIGVEKGDFSDMIFKITTPVKLHLIDAWGDPTRYHDGLKLSVEKKFSHEIKTDNIKINVGFSTDVLKNMPDNYFDWVYLDTDHTYEVTAEELRILKNKMKPNGIIAGHDYIIGNWGGDVRYGVIEAVHEFCVKDNWELIFITINKNEMPSFAIKKISE